MSSIPLRGFRRPITEKLIDEKVNEEDDASQEFGEFRSMDTFSVEGKNSKFMVMNFLLCQCFRHFNELEKVLSEII